MGDPAQMAGEDPVTLGSPGSRGMESSGTFHMYPTRKKDKIEKRAGKTSI